MEIVSEDDYLEHFVPSYVQINATTRWACGLEDEHELISVRNVNT